MLLTSENITLSQPKCPHCWVELSVNQFCVAYCGTRLENNTQPPKNKSQGFLVASIVQHNASSPAPIRRKSTFQSKSWRNFDFCPTYMYIPVFDYIFGHPKVGLSSRHPIWSSMPSSVWSAHEAWKEEIRNKQEIPNQFLITDPTSCQPGFNLKWSDWTIYILNRYRTGHGICAASLHVWDIRDDPLCDCGSKQTMSHIVNECPLMKFPGGLQVLHSASEDSITWLHKLSIR